MRNQVSNVQARTLLACGWFCLCVGVHSDNMVVTLCLCKDVGCLASVYVWVLDRTADHCAHFGKISCFPDRQPRMPTLTHIISPE